MGKKFLVFAATFFAIFLVLFAFDIDFNRFFHSSRIETIAREEGRNHCIQPSIDLERTSNKKSVAAALVLLSQDIASINVDKSESYIPKEYPFGLTEFESVSYQLCVMHGDGVIDKNKYLYLFEKILPQMKRDVLDRNIAGFDLEIESVEFFGLNGGNALAEITVAFKSLSERNDVTNSLIYGQVVLHDAALVQEHGKPKFNEKACDDLRSCIAVDGSLAKEDDPTLIRGGKKKVRSNFTVQFKPSADLQHVTVFVAFYQKETQAGGVCTKDDSKIQPKGGIPFLKELSADGSVKSKASCYFSMDHKTVKYEVKAK